MSATNRGAKRMDADYYPTPEWCVHALLKKWTPPHPKGVHWRRSETQHWLEPCAGDGAIIRAVTNFYAGQNLQHPPTWTAVELRDDVVRQRGLIEPTIHWNQPQDFLTWDAPQKFGACLTNPPFNLAMPFILKSMQISAVTLMLLRLNFLGSKERSAFHREHPSNLYVLDKRPSFIGGATDSCEYAWFEWPGDNKWTLLECD